MKKRQIFLYFWITIRVLGTIGVAMVLSMLVDSISDAIATGNRDLLTPRTIFCMLYAVALGLVIWLTERFKAGYVKKMMCGQKEQLFRGMMQKSIAEHRQQNSSQDLTLLTQNLQTWETDYLKNQMSIYEAVIGITAAVILLVNMNPVIAVISVAAMAIPSAIPKIYQKKIKELQKAVMDHSVSYTKKIKDVLNGYEVVKTYRHENTMQEQHKEQTTKLEESKQKMADCMAGLYGLTNMLSISVQFLIMFLAGIFAVEGNITIGNIIAITQLTGQVITPAFELSGKLTLLKSTQPIREQMRDLMKKDDRKIRYTDLKTRLEVRNLSFAYEDTTILQNQSMVFEAGKKYAIVGESGSGKSTFLKLLAGYYTDYDGKIVIDGQEDGICDSAFIHQDVVLFDDTVRNNITLYDEVAPELLAWAIHIACLDDTIAGLPCGLDTPMEENGQRFSGGERQRIAIARALVHKKSLLLVDEATSALDENNAKRVESNLLSLPDVTCIVVTHHLTEKNAARYDKIFELEKMNCKYA